MAILSLNELGALARRLRKERDLTQADIAEHLSGDTLVAQSHVSQAEQGVQKYAGLAARIVEEIGGVPVASVFRVPLEEQGPEKRDD